MIIDHVCSVPDTHSMNFNDFILYPLIHPLEGGHTPVYSHSSSKLDHIGKVAEDHPV